MPIILMNIHTVYQSNYAIGTTYMYTTHGYTLLSAVIEGASGKKFTSLMQDMFKEMEMTNTYLDQDEPLIYNRSK